MSITSQTSKPYQQALENLGLASIRVHHAQQTTSTFDMARQHLSQNHSADGHTHVFIAAQQTQGRGQAGRPWCNGADNLMFTLSLPYPHPIQSNLALEIALAIIECPLIQCLSGVGLKWPNDLVYTTNQGSLQKWGGILIERFINPKEQSHLHIGIGINLSPIHTITKTPSTHLNAIATQQQQPLIQQHTLLAQICLQIALLFKTLHQHTWQQSLSQRYTPKHVLQNKTIQVFDSMSQSTLHCTGKVVGVQQDGALQVELETPAHHKKIQPIYSGHIQLIS